MISLEEKAIEKSLRSIARRLAKAFNIPNFRRLRVDNSIQEFGLCTDKGEIVIRVSRLYPKVQLNPTTILDTLCHEVAHIAIFAECPEHRRLTAAMRIYLQRNGITIAQN